MLEMVEARVRELARRAGVRNVPTPVLVAALALLSVAVVAALVRWWPQPADVGLSVSRQAAAPKPVPAEATVASAAPAAASAIASGTVCVDVAGAVRHPGVYTLADGARVHDAVEAAGGTTPSAASSAINLAAKLSDGQQILVPTDTQVAAGTVPAAATGGTVNDGGSGTAASGAKVNLNTADAAALDALPGVGPSTAAKIVADRQANGPFRSVSDLSRVAGIGPKKLGQLRPLVCVN